MTNRELLFKAMPIVSLSRQEWEMFERHLVEVKRKDGDLNGVLEKLFTNQSRIEVIGNYFDYFADTLDEEVRDDSTVLVHI